MSRFDDALLLADGCHMHSHCLTCPLDACIFDEAKTSRWEVNPARNAEILRLHGDGLNSRQIAAAVNMSSSGVRSILARMVIA